MLERHLLHRSERWLKTAPAVHTVNARAVLGEITKRRRAPPHQDKLTCEDRYAALGADLEANSREHALEHVVG